MKKTDSIEFGKETLLAYASLKMEVRTKLDYLYNNLLNEKWNLSKTPETYSRSSACFYESGIDQFGCLNHYQEFFG
jgi:putative transposase